MFNSSELKRGDTIFLFVDFPYDFQIGLPLKIADGIDLILTPKEHHLYDLNNNDKLYPYRYIHPLSNLGLCGRQVCLRISNKWKNPLEVYSQMMTALRLIKPLRVSLSGSFVYNSENDPCANPILFWRFSVLNTEDSSELFTLEDFKLAKTLFKIIRSIKRQYKQLRRPTLALDSFSQITLGESTSYSMVYQGLFATLETIFGSPSNANDLGEMVGLFLKGRFNKSSKIADWVSKHYDKGRNFISHGNPDFYIVCKKINYAVSPKRYSEILKRHEITRICILGLLGNNNQDLKIYNVQTSQKKIGKGKRQYTRDRLDILYRTLKTNLKAKRRYLKNQKIRTT